MQGLVVRRCTRSGRPGRTGFVAVALAAGALSALSGPAGAAVIGHWRMETDDNAGATAVSVPNEVGGANPLTSNSATLALPVPGINNAPSATATQVFDPIANTTSANTRALDGSVNVVGSVASYAALNAASITVEGFFRTGETTGTLLSRLNGTASGFSIATPNDLTVTYIVGGTSRTLAGTTAIDLGTPYTHVAFTYDATTGLASLYANGTLRNSFTVAGGGPLYAGTETNALSIGPDYDGGGLSSGSAVGVIDEIRLSNEALLPAQFLQAVPEPGGMVVLAVPALLAASRRRRRPRG